MLSKSVIAVFLLVISLAMASAQTPDGIFGEWTPRDAAKTEALFAVGLSDVTPAGMRIAQMGDTLRIVRADSDGALQRMQQVNPRFETESIYRLDGSRSAGAARYYASGSGSASWDGRALVIESATRDASRRSVYRLEEGALRELTTVTLASGAVNTVSRYYDRSR
jgi:hypothetical protein